MSIEHTEFSKRLRQALIRASYSADSPTALCRDFNLRFSGQSITVHAARKWLTGESIPTQDKLRVLAEWLQCDLAWLRFGLDSKIRILNPRNNGSKLEQENRRLIADISLLDAHHRAIVSAMIGVLAKACRERSKG